MNMLMFSRVIVCVLKVVNFMIVVFLVCDVRRFLCVYVL